jgi:peptide chain release factor 1
MGLERASGFEAKLDGILARRDELSHQLSSAAASEQYAALAREYAELDAIAGGIEALRSARSELRGLEEMLEDAGLDAEMRKLAEDELHQVEHRLPELERQVKLALLPKDEADEKGAILEIRAGTGGDEAALFAGDLYRMYERYAELHGWRFDPMSLHETGLGGFKEAIVAIKGQGVFARLKFEAGVHRVQRVPVTEGSGRIHTSAATVAVLPEAEEVDVQIDEKDLRIDVYRSSGPGGQSVNTTDSAVRITHLPSGIVVTQQDEKSQHKNKAKALKILRARLYEQERSEREAERAQNRKGQVGSGDRSERIRTYNFPQGRCTDHRINLTLYKLDKVLSGEALDEIIEALVAEDQAARLGEVTQA